MVRDWSTNWPTSWWAGAQQVHGLGRALRQTSVCVLLALSVTAPLAAQSDASRVAVGDSVRVRFPGAMTVGASVQAWRGFDVMILDTEGLESAWPVSVFDIESLGLLTQRTPREGLRHFAMLGAVSGLFIGAAVALALHAGGAIDDPNQPPALIFVNGLRGAGWGILGGTLFGAVYGGRRPGTGWIQIELPRL
jgi:hypothetical protein